MSHTADFLVVGAGVIGLNLALQLKKRFSDSQISVLEKEAEPGLHASGRNSGVLHAGFYYTSDSMKARFCREGNRHLTDYCLERKLPINRCGKLVVAADESELAGLTELFRRGQANGVAIEEISDVDAREIEPKVLTYQRALYSPNTATVSPTKIMHSLIDDVKEAGIEIWTDTAFVGCKWRRVKTSRGDIEAGYVVNAAGLYADRIALNYGFSQDYRILPFKGLYLDVDHDSVALNTNIYPVPNLKHPFLGVHFTVDVAGHTKIGPTAIPAFWREHYSGLENFNMAEFADIVMRETGLLIHNDFGFRTLAVEEMKKHSRKYMAKLSGEMVSGLNEQSLSHWGKPGIRAQLMNIRNRKLEMDFKFEGDDRSFHVLNAVSPAFTCSMPFSKYLVDQMVELIG